MCIVEVLLANAPIMCVDGAHAVESIPLARAQMGQIETFGEMLKEFNEESRSDQLSVIFQH